MSRRRVPERAAGPVSHPPPPDTAGGPPVVCPPTIPSPPLTRAFRVPFLYISRPIVLSVAVFLCK